METPGCVFRFLKVSPLKGFFTSESLLGIRALSSQSVTAQAEAAAVSSPCASELKMFKASLCFQQTLLSKHPDLYDHVTHSVRFKDPACVH